MNSSARPNRLGRGLSALFGDAEPRTGGEPAGARHVAIELIRPSAFQPRRQFGEAELEALAQSIRENGIIQPLLVRPIDDPETPFELVAGERRWRAAQRAGLHDVPVVVRPLDDRAALEVALVENLQREDLTALEEAEAYRRLMQEFGRTQSTVAEAVGKSRSYVANTVRLLALPEQVRHWLHEGALTAGHARALLGADDPGALAAEIVRRGLNVRMTEKLAQARGAQRRPPRRDARDVDTVSLERELGSTLGLKVTLARKARGGALTVHYASLDQLDRVLALLRAR